MIEGPVVEFPSEAAVPLGMAIHELTTNAAKHGAFSTSEGQVEVRWTVSDEKTGPVVHLAWTERNGPPVHPPTSQGFGSRLLRRVLTAQLEAKVDVAYDEAGLRCTIAVPIPHQDKSVPTEALVEMARGVGIPAEGCDDLETALVAVGRLGLEPAPRILIAGSLYLAGEVLALNGTPPE